MGDTVQYCWREGGRWTGCSAPGRPGPEPADRCLPRERAEPIRRRRRGDQAPDQL